LQELFLEVVPVLAGPFAANKHFNDVDDRKPPFTSMKDSSYVLALKYRQLIDHAHTSCLYTGTS
jgi:hypothetical protein